MWWSVPKGITEFGTWRELTTVYHEGVPGHHLQVAQTVYRSTLLNRWRRLETGDEAERERGQQQQRPQQADRAHGGEGRGGVPLVIADAGNAVGRRGAAHLRTLWRGRTR